MSLNAAASKASCNEQSKALLSKKKGKPGTQSSVLILSLDKRTARGPIDPQEGESVAPPPRIKMLIKMPEKLRGRAIQ